MSTEHVSYVPNRSGRFVRYSYAPRTSSNRFVEIGRFFYNLIIGIFQLTNLLHYALTTFNNMLSSLPFFIQNFIHAILAICFPFYSLYRGFMMIVNRIHNVTYPIYRAITLLARLFAFFITLPIRIITFLYMLIQSILKNLLIVLIFAGIIIGLIVICSNEEQYNYMKSYLQNATDVILKYSSMV